MPNNKKNTASPIASTAYTGLVGGIRELLDAARRSSARAVNALMTATYWEIGCGYHANSGQFSFR